MLTRLVGYDSELYAWAEPRAEGWEVRLETGVVLRGVPGTETDVGDKRTAPTLRLTCTLAALRQRAASALAAPSTTETPSRPAGGRQRATSRKGGGR